MRKELRVVKTCEECGKVWMGRKDSIRCSPTCNNKAWVRVNRPGVKKHGLSEVKTDV